MDRVNEIRSSVPAITHIDFSARIQTVDKITNPLFYSLIDRFRDLTGCPLLINTHLLTFEGNQLFVALKMQLIVF